jgi:hypothetical protein
MNLRIAETLVLSIATTNLFNRLNVHTLRQLVGAKWEQ